MYIIFISSFSSGVAKLINRFGTASVFVLKIAYFLNRSFIRQEFFPFYPLLDFGIKRVCINFVP